MSIIPLAKVSIFSPAAAKQTVLRGLQELGCLHLIVDSSEIEEGAFVRSQPEEEARRALRYLMDVPRRRHQVKVDADFQLEDVVHQALANKQERREAEDRLLRLQARREELEPWGTFTLPDLDDLGGQRLWFFRVPHAKSKAFHQALEDLDAVWTCVHASPRNQYIVIISPEEPDASVLPVRRAHVGSVSTDDVEQQWNQAMIQLEDIEAEHQALSRWIFLLSKHLNRADDHAALLRAAEGTLEQENLVQIRGWIPRPLLNQLEEFSRREGLAFLAEAIQPGDEPPTLMSNASRLQGGEDLVTFYETPGYRDWDPSVVVFFSFAIFFSMILADAGYALLLLALIGILWKSMGRTAGGRHFRTLCLVGLGFAVVYGVLVGSYFGIEPSPGTVAHHLKILNLNDFNAMMKLSIAVGGLHLILANGIVAVRELSLAGKARPLGWIAVILGGLTLYFSAGEAAGGHAGIGLISGGLLTILLLSSDRPLTSPAQLVLRLFDGLGSLAGISKLFGDVMSYLRLFALGLASASLALTFNQLARQVIQSEVALAVPIALLILVLGHGINILLGIISGFVHGLRLNYIEFFNWSLSEEGYPFVPFAKKEPSS